MTYQLLLHCDGSVLSAVNLEVASHVASASAVICSLANAYNAMAMSVYRPMSHRDKRVPSTIAFDEGIHALKWAAWGQAARQLMHQLPPWRLPLRVRPDCAPAALSAQ